MITVSSNPLVTASNTKLVYRAIKSLDLERQGAPEVPVL